MPTHCCASEIPTWDPRRFGLGNPVAPCGAETIISSQIPRRVNSASGRHGMGRRNGAEGILWSRIGISPVQSPSRRHGRSPQKSFARTADSPSVAGRAAAMTPRSPAWPARERQFGAMNVAGAPWVSVNRTRLIWTGVAMAGSLIMGFGGLGAFLAFRFNGPYQTPTVLVALGLIVFVLAQVRARRCGRSA